MSPSKRIDAFGRRHPWLMVAGLLVLICVALLSIEATFPIRGAIQRVAEVIQVAGVLFVCSILPNR